MSKLKFCLALGALLFGFLKCLQCSISFYKVCSAILNDDCNVEKCFSEYCEMIFVICLLLPLTLLICGVSKVKIMMVKCSSDEKFAFQSKQSYIGVWLVTHVILIGYDVIVQYEIRFGTDSREYSRQSVIYKSVEMSESLGIKPEIYCASLTSLLLSVVDLISFYIVCRLNILLIDEEAESVRRAYSDNKQQLEITKFVRITFDESNKVST